MELPYGITKRDSKYYPTLFGDMFGSRREGAKRFDTVEMARKFLKKQATNRLLMANTGMRKHGVYPTEYCQFAQKWLDTIDEAILFIEPEKKVVAPTVPARHYSFGTTLKYIVAECHDERGNVHELPLIFPYILVHADMADTMRMSAREADLWKCEIVGAGFVTFDEKGPNFFGESESLGIKSRGDKDRDAFKRCEKNTTSTLTVRK